jgi:hypothetical protein
MTEEAIHVIKLYRQAAQVAGNTHRVALCDRALAEEPGALIELTSDVFGAGAAKLPALRDDMPLDPKPCPFCGSTALNLDNATPSAGDEGWVSCTDCNGDGPCSPSPVLSWNRRAEVKHG